MLEDLNKFVESYPFPLWEGLLRIIFAMLLGAAIGLERERSFPFRPERLRIRAER